MVDEPEQFRGYTAAQLRVLMQSGQWPTAHTREAIEWLGGHERRELERNSASSTEQRLLARESNDIALEAKTIAKQAKTVAFATLIVAIIGSAAAIAGLFIH